MGRSFHRHHAETLRITLDVAHREHMYIGCAVNRSEHLVVDDGAEETQVIRQPELFRSRLNAFLSLRPRMQCIIRRIPHNQQHDIWTNRNDARHRLHDKFSQPFTSG